MTGCGNTQPTVFPDDQNRKRAGGGTTYSDTSATIFGSDGLNIFGGDDESEAQNGGVGIGVNSYLWRASLDTVAFMPLSSADPFGGVIITDWYSPPEAADERFKINVYILGRDLRADGVRTAVFRQRQSASGDWVDAAIDEQTVVDLENAILTRARQLRVASAE
jgi:hypothetical protein